MQEEEISPETRILLICGCWMFHFVVNIHDDSEDGRYTGLFDNSIPANPSVNHYEYQIVAYRVCQRRFTPFGHTPFLLLIMVDLAWVEQAHKDVVSINSTLSAYERSAEWQRVLHFFAEQRPGN